MNPDNAFTAWVCQTCYLTHHGYDVHELGYEPDETPLGMVEIGTIVTDGMLTADHECEDRWLGHRSLIGCGEEIRDFDTYTCEGCASRLAGTRHALTFWEADPEPEHRQTYRADISDWWCEDCQTVSDFCQQINPS